jgi:hypothetical protein
MFGRKKNLVLLAGKKTSISEQSAIIIASSLTLSPTSRAEES